jgi:hypothetical protein
MLVKYVRNSKRQRIGCVVAISRDQIGWSLCNVKLDKFDKQYALDIAKLRAQMNPAPIAPTVRPDFMEMLERAHRYYK